MTHHQINHNATFAQLAVGRLFTFISRCDAVALADASTLEATIAISGIDQIFLTLASYSSVSITYMYQASTREVLPALEAALSRNIQVSALLDAKIAASLAAAQARPEWSTASLPFTRYYASHAGGDSVAPQAEALALGRILSSVSSLGNQLTADSALTAATICDAVTRFNTASVLATGKTRTSFVSILLAMAPGWKHIMQTHTLTPYSGINVDVYSVDAAKLSNTITPGQPFKGRFAAAESVTLEQLVLELEIVHDVVYNRGASFDQLDAAYQYTSAASADKFTNQLQKAAVINSAITTVMSTLRVAYANSALATLTAATSTSMQQAIIVVHGSQSILATAFKHFSGINDHLLFPVYTQLGNQTCHYTFAKTCASDMIEAFQRHIDQCELNTSFNIGARCKSLRTNGHLTSLTLANTFYKSTSLPFGKTPLSPSTTHYVPSGSAGLLKNSFWNSEDVATADEIFLKRTIEVDTTTALADLLKLFPIQKDDLNTSMELVEKSQIILFNSGHYRNQFCNGGTVSRGWQYAPLSPLHSTYDRVSKMINTGQANASCDVPLPTTSLVVELKPTVVVLPTSLVIPQAQLATIVGTIRDKNRYWGEMNTEIGMAGSGADTNWLSHFASASVPKYGVFIKGDGTTSIFTRHGFADAATFTVKEQHFELDTYTSREDVRDIVLLHTQKDGQ